MPCGSDIFFCFEKPMGFVGCRFLRYPIGVGVLAVCVEAPVSIVGLILVLISFGISPTRVSCWNLVTS